MGITPEQYLGVTWFMVIICVCLVAARLSVRTWLRQWTYWVSDTFLVLSVLCFMLIAAGDTYKYVNDGSIFGMSKTESFARWRFAVSAMFYMQFYLPRFSLLAFYYELFPISEAKLRICLHAVTAFTVMAFFATTFLDLFWCGPDVSQNWSPNPAACSLAGKTIVMYINWPISMASEILVFLLPFPLLRRLKKLSKRERIGLICIFLLGSVTIAVSTARLIFAVRLVMTLDTLLVAMTEIATQIMVVALPALRPLFGVAYRKRMAASQSKDYRSSGGGGSRTEERRLVDASDKGFLDSTGGTVSTVVSSQVDLQDLRSQEPWDSIVLPQYLSGK